MKYRHTLLALLIPYAAVAQPIPCDNGFAGEYPCHNVDLLAQPTAEGASDLWGWTDPETGTEYAIIFLGDFANQATALTFYDLSDPTAPVEVARLSLLGGVDARVYGNYVFFVGYLPGMSIFDLTRLRTVENPPATFDPDVVYDGGGISRAHNLSLDPVSGFAYPVLVRDSDLCSSELHIVDVRKPLNPTYAGCFDNPTLDGFHDTHCITYDGPDSDYAGRELCFGSALAGVLAIVDVTDKANPVLISEAPYPNAAYTHQGWLTDDGRYFLLGDEADESLFEFNTRTVVFDVQDLDEPEFAFEHFAESPAIDHNLIIHNSYVFQANYRSGLRVLDLSEIDDETLTEVAFFDTLPEGGDLGFSGAWGVYPFFGSGIVIVSDDERGLFVLQPRLGETTDTEILLESEFVLTTHPNPFADRATVTLDVETTQHITVSVYDMLGREIAVLHDGPLTAGIEHELRLESADLPAGSYIVRAAGATFTVSQAFTLVR